MWTAKVSRRELFTFYLGSTKVVENRARATSQINVEEGEDLTLIWEYPPQEHIGFPALVIVADGNIRELLISLVAAPQIPAPITALTRIISRAEAAQYFDSDTLPLNERVFPAVTALVFIEAVLLGEGRLTLKQLTPLVCKRTLTFAWGRAIAARGPTKSFVDLPSRWLDVFSMLNTARGADTAHRAVESNIGVLSLLTQLANGIRPESLSGALAFELLNGNIDSQERAWLRLAEPLSHSVGIETLHSLTREARGTYLQDALRTLATIGNRDRYHETAAACAFLATRLAPGSLEHLDVLKAPGRPEMLAWYAIYAALQRPQEIMSLYNGLGFRLMRDLRRLEEKLDTPAADISYEELKIASRAGLDSIAGKTGHASELQVELIPYVSTSFTFQPRNRSRSNEGQQGFDLEPAEAVETPLSPRATIERVAAQLAQLAKSLPDSSEDISAAKRSRRKSG